MARARAACIVFDLDQVLLMRRSRDGQEYYVVPGGGIEPGETALDACLRELPEETSLRATHASPVISNEDQDGARTEYFLIHDPTGRVRLGGPEAERNSPTNQYELRWIALQDIETIPLRPAEAGAAIVTAYARAQQAS